MDVLRLVLSEKEVLLDCASQKTPPPASFTTAVPEPLVSAFDDVARSENAPEEALLRASAACICCEIIAARPTAVPPTRDSLLRITRLVRQYSYRDLQELLASAPTAASLKEDGLEREDIGPVLLTLQAITAATAAPAAPSNSQSSSRTPRKIVNIGQRMRDLGLDDLPEIFLPSPELVKAILLKREDGCKLPLHFNPKTKPLFPPDADHYLSFVPSSMDLDEHVQEAAGHLFSQQGMQDASQALLVQTSEKVKSEVLPSLLHSLVRARHAIALIVCEVVPPRDYLRLLLLVTSVVPLVASHGMLRSCSSRTRVATTYESWVFQRAHNASLHATGADALALLQSINAEKVRDLAMVPAAVVPAAPDTKPVGGGKQRRRGWVPDRYQPYDAPGQQPSPLPSPILPQPYAEATGTSGAKGGKGGKGSAKGQGKQTYGKGKRHE